jgi:exosortase
MEDLHTLSRRLTGHHLWFLLFWILSLVPFRSTLEALVGLSLQDSRYPHNLLIPLMTAALIYLQRKRIFTGERYSLSTGLPLLIVGIVMFCLAQTQLSTLSPNDRLSVSMLAIVLVWIAGFALCYGAQCFLAALFPLLFLLLMVPMPTVVLDRTELAFQTWSATMTGVLFKVLGIPVLWQGFTFSMSGAQIEIAKECSGIRSGLALIVASILAGHLFLQSTWKKILFSLLTVPVAIFKNAVRIVTISYLGVYVDTDFLYGGLHHHGGPLFSLVALAILVPLLFTLKKTESRPMEKQYRIGEGSSDAPLK